MHYVICLKVGNLYPAEYVNKLFRAIQRNTMHQFKFICYTDDARGVESPIECRPLTQKLHGWWHKIWFFSPEIGIKERILYFDLDTVVVGPIDEYFSFKGVFAILRDLYAAERDPRIKNMGSAIMAWQGGWGYYLWENFRHNVELNLKFRGDQNYIMRTVRQEEVTYWQDYLKDHKLISYKAHVRQNQNAIPPGTSVVCFHGSPRPHEVSDLPWMVEHWK